MDRVRVDSSAIASVGYSPDERVLEVEFQSGRVYQYLDVPAREYEALMTAGSMGRHFNRRIRDGFKRRELPQPEPREG
jgi:KTSC domain